MHRLGIFACIFLWAAGHVTAQEYATSQDFKVSLNEPRKEVKESGKVYINSDKNVVAIKWVKNSTFLIQCFDAADMHFIAESENELNDKHATFQKAEQLGDDIYVFFSTYDKSAGTQNLYAQKININTATLAKEPKQILSIDGKVAGIPMFGVSNFDQFNFVFSKNEDIMLVHFRIKPDKKNDKQNYDHIGVYVFDDSLNQMWGGIREMQNTEAELTIMDFAVDSEGNVYLLGKLFKDGVYKEKKSKKDEVVNYTLELMKLTGTDDVLVQKTLALDDNKFLKDARLHEQDADHMVIAGYYSGTTSDAVTGTFVFRFEKNKGDFTKNYYPIPMDILNAYESKKQTKRNEKDDDNDEAGMNALFLNEVHIDDAGNIVLLGEEYWRSEKTSMSSNGSSRVLYTFHYNDVVVTKINSNGDLAWMAKIPKRQVSGHEDGEMSFATLYNAKGIYVIYLDNVKNFGLSKDETPKLYKDSNGKDGFLTSSKIDFQTGEVTREHLFDLQDLNGVEVSEFGIVNILSLDDDEIAVEVNQKKKNVWINVELN